MSRENCSFCNACKNINKPYCDKCNAYCCVENMKNHQKIFYLGDQFETKVKYAENELCTKSNEVRKNIDEKCNINISRNSSSLNDCENFFNSMENTFKELDYKKKKFNEKINQNKKYFQNEKNYLMNDYNQKLKRINDFFDDLKKDIDDGFINNNKMANEIINTFNNSKNILEEEKANILKRDVNKVVVDFISAEKTKIENDYENEKKLIDEKNHLIKYNLEYTEEEKNLENDYLSTINNIKNYSKKIPFFDKWIQVYNLNKYLN